MAPIAISFVAFALALVGILLGSVIQILLPEGHLSSDSKEVVKLSMGVVATLAALVLGLLVASAKSTLTRARVRSFRSPQIWRKRDSCSFRIWAAQYPFRFWQCCCSG